MLVENVRIKFNVGGDYMKMEVVQMIVPEDSNIIVGRTHFIKSVEDIAEAVLNSVPNVKFGLSFCEASGPRLIRYDGNDDELIKAAIENARKSGAGHTFYLLIRNAFPINLLRDLRSVPEVVEILCATANPTQLIIAETDQGRGILGVIDGQSPLGVETEEDKNKRKEFLRKIGYKRF